MRFRLQMSMFGSGWRLDRGGEPIGNPYTPARGASGGSRVRPADATDSPPNPHYNAPARERIYAYPHTHKAGAKPTQSTMKAAALTAVITRNRILCIDKKPTPSTSPVHYNVLPPHIPGAIR